MFWSFVFVSNFDIRISSLCKPRTNFVPQCLCGYESFIQKQTQFPGCSNKRKVCYNNGLCQFTPAQPLQKQSQNKANFRKARMNLNFYLKMDYENQGRLQTPGKQTQSNPISNMEISDFVLRISPLLLGVFVEEKRCKKLQKSALFCNFSHNFSNIFKRFRTFLSVFFLPILPNPYKLTLPSPFSAQKPTLPPKNNLKKPVFFPN